VPLVANPHGLEEFKVRHPLKRLAYAPFRAWVRAGCRAADRVVATDRSMGEEVARLLEIDPERVVVLPNGVDVHGLRALVSDEIRSQLKARYPVLAEDSGPLGISVGRLEANKGFKHLLRALALSASQGARWRWLIVGEGSMRQDLEALAGEPGISGRVLLTGSLPDVELHTLYSMCDLFVHPTLYEGSSLVTLEAMAHGLPVVASAIGGIPDKVIPGETGFPVPPGDEQALSDRLQWMWSHPEERLEMGRRGLRLVSEHFSWQTVAKETLELFYALVAEHRACG
jgi:glycosyltransferase involved in cell wall biosynthesis